MNKYDGVEKYKDVIIQMRAVEIIYICICIACIAFDIVQRLFHFRKDDIELPIISTPTDNNNVNMIKKVIGAVKLTRLPTCVFIDLIVCIPLFFKTQNLLMSFLSGLPFMLAAMTGFALNDFLDYRKDKISKPHRAIPSKLITLHQAVLITFIIGLLTLVFSIYSAQTTTQFFLYFTAFIGVIIYNLIVKYAAVFKTLCAAFICVLPIIFVAISIEEIVLAIPISIIAFIYILGRELRMDILDFEGDKADNIKTLPILFGKKLSSIIAQVVIYSTIIISCIILMSRQNIFVGILFSIIIVLSQLLCEVFWKSGDQNKMRKSILMQWIPMLTSFFLCINI